MEKILEIKGEDWMKGISIQSGMAMGGLFQTANHFDPFETMGYLKAGLTAVAIDAATITTEVKHLASFSNGADGYVFALGDRAGTAAKTLYRIKLTDSTVVDYSTNIDRNALTGALTHNGVTVYKGRLVYETAGAIRSNTLTPTDGNDTSILVDSLTGSSVTPTSFSVGPYGELYFNNNQGLGKITSVTSTSGNTATAFTFVDTAFVSRDICNDGTYTVFIADNNEYKVSTVNSVCRVYFWDSTKTVADIIYDIPDSYLISVKYVDGKVIILGASGIWICNSASSPKLVFPLTSSQLPASANAVTAQGNILYWGMKGIGKKIYAYGSKVGKPILFTPWAASVPDSTDLLKAIVASGTYFVTASDSPSVNLLNSGSTRANAALLTATTVLTRPHTLAQIKVTLKAPMSSGHAMVIAVYNGNGSVISDTDTKSFAVDGAKQTLVFTPKAVAGYIPQFEDFYLQINPQGGAVVQRVSVYGTPSGDSSQQI